MSAMLGAAKWAGRSAKNVFAVIGFTGTVGAGALVYRNKKAIEDINGGAKKRLLVLPFHKIQLVDKHPNGKNLNDFSLEKSTNTKIAVEDLVEVIHAAASDPEIVGIVGEFGRGKSFGGGQADAEEIRTALRVFKESHRKHAEPNFEHTSLLQKKGHDAPKPLVAYADSFSGMERSSNPDYYLASVFNEVYLQNQGSLDLFGFGSEIPFLRKTMEKYGARVHCYKHGAYKNAPNGLTHSYLTKEHKENVENYLFALNEYQNDSIARSRKHAKLTEDVWKLIQNSGSFTPQDALKMGLIDGLRESHPLDQWLYSREGDESPSFLPPKDKDTDAISLAQYKKRLALRKRLTKNRAGAATLQTKAFESLRTWADSNPWLKETFEGQGWYQDRLQESQKNPKETVALLTLKGGIDAKAVRKLEPALTKIKKDGSVKAVVLRVDSPGGTLDASEEVLQYLKNLPGKPRVVVSFGNVAASGGYYVASHADAIFASNSTITGSIGVFGVRLDLSGVAAQYGVRFGHVSTSDFALSNSPFSAVTKVQHANSKKGVDRAYARFKQVVSEGRELEEDYVHGLAEGRVWTGLQAKQNGLVDEIGGLRRAIDYAKQNYCDRSEEAQVVDMCEEKGWMAFFKQWSENQQPAQEAKAQVSSPLMLGHNNLLPTNLIPKKAFGMYMTMDENAAIRSLLGSDDESE